MKITTMNKAAADEIRAAIEAALPNALGLFDGSIEAKLGRRGTYDQDAGTLTLKLEISLAGCSREGHLFREQAHLFGLDGSDLGRRFNLPISGRIFTIAGLNPRATRRPVITQCSDGKEYAYPAIAIKSLLERWEIARA